MHVWFDVFGVVIVNQCECDWDHQWVKFWLDCLLLWFKDLRVHNAPHHHVKVSMQKYVVVYVSVKTIDDECNNSRIIE